MVLSIVKDHQLVYDAAQLHRAHGSIGASTKDGSVSFLAVIFVIVVLVLAGSNTKAVFANLASFLWRFLIAALATVIFIPSEAKYRYFSFFRVILASNEISTWTDVGIEFYESLIFLDIFHSLVMESIHSGIFHLSATWLSDRFIFIYICGNAIVLFIGFFRCLYNRSVSLFPKRHP
jgi:hypothetical protein